MAREASFRLLVFLLVLLAAACNLSNAPEEQQIALTDIPTNTPPVTRTLLPTGGVPTTLPITTLTVPTTLPQQFPTSQLPPTVVALFPSPTPAPISIVILSPIPGNVVAGNVQVLGAAIHPLFLQYQLEFGPDPNPGNLWYPATGISQQPVVNGLLGIWNTSAIQDSTYQLRLRVTLRDGTSLATVVNNVRIQNQAPTPVPSATPNIQRPIAAFTQDRTSGLSPLVVRFFNQSSGTINTYFWTFGDGGSSSEANPIYTFRNPGIYTVTFTVTGPGGSSNFSQQINVQSASAPVAAFTQDKTSGPSPLTVQFTNQSTGVITTYNWNFGDGTTSTEQNPLHQFTAVGTYNVILSVTGPGGTSFVTRKITVEDPVIPAPVAAFTPDKTTGTAPLTVMFANGSTGQITSYVWDFGDGQTSTDKNAVHTFTGVGNYRVRLTAIGPGGQSTAESTITVNQPPNAPIAAFFPSTTSGNIPLTVQFTNQSTGQITSYAWNFGDGATSVEASPSHTFTSAGTYMVRLTVTGPGGTTETQATITAINPVAAPIVAFSANPTSGDVPLTVNFSNQSTGESLSFAWDFGDGQTSTEVNPTHIYNAAGSYTVKLTASNSAGSQTAQAVVTVSLPAPTSTSTVPPTATSTAVPALPPTASFTADVTTGTAPLTVNLSSTSTGDITSYAWTVQDSAGSIIATGDQPNLTTTLLNAGDYTINLTVTGPAGSSTATPLLISVSSAAPSINGSIAYATDRDGNVEIYRLDPDGTRTNLTNSLAEDTDPAWSFDGSRIAFTSSRDGNAEIYVMNMDGSDVRRVTTDTDVIADDGEPAWTPDGRIIFVTNRDGNNEIYIINADGSGMANLTLSPANDVAPAVSPDGSRVVFMSDRDGNNDLYVLSLGDGSVVNITNHPGLDASPSWTPDGRILFVSDRDTAFAQIYVMDADGSNVIRLSDGSNADISPAMTPDGSQIAFVSQREGFPQIYIMNANGTNVVKLSDGSVAESVPAWRP